MNKKFLVLTLPLALIFSVACMLPGPAFSADKVIKLKVSNFFPPPTFQSKVLGEFCRDLEKRTDGKVKVDYFKPIKGYENALKKSELPVIEPPEENSGHLIWLAGQLLPGLTVDLERKEWDSKMFSSIWYILPEKVAKK